MKPLNRLIFAFLFTLLSFCCVGMMATPAHASSEPAKETIKVDAKVKEASESKPRKTFEGIEPLFYLDPKRRPYIEPFHKTESDEYFICRGTVGEWYRQLLANDFNKLAERDDMSSVSGSTCALHLINTQTGKKLPIVSVEMFPSTDDMRSCVLAEICPHLRTVILYVKDRTLYRTFIVGDAKKKIRRQYCLDNQSNILAEKSCWRHFEGD
jgi:hypothetical protein